MNKYSEIPWSNFKRQTTKRFKQQKLKPEIVEWYVWSICRQKILN